MQLSELFAAKLELSLQQVSFSNDGNTVYRGVVQPRSLWLSRECATIALRMRANCTKKTALHAN
jgi:hypothetical protein